MWCNVRHIVSPFVGTNEASCPKISYIAFCGCLGGNTKVSKVKHHGLVLQAVPVNYQESIVWFLSVNVVSLIHMKISLTVHDTDTLSAT